MNELDELRKEINAVDKEMASLFERRMSAVAGVAKYKMTHGLPVYDAAREAEVVERNSSFIGSDEIRSYYVGFLKNEMELSKSYQRRLTDGVRIAYSGVEGAFAHIAATRIFPDGAHISYASFAEAYAAVEEGVCDCAVLPIENSYAGEVGQVMDLMFSGSLFVSGVYDLKITQNLLGISGAKIDGIKKVISHPQALGQCAKYIKAHGFETTDASNTARAAQYVAQSNDKTLAAIASEETANLYGLTVLDHDINASDTNTTRFAVFSRAENTQTGGSLGNFMLMFTVKNESGALAEAINVIGKYGFNMKVLRSRPMKKLAWQYYFYAEAEGDESSERGREMLNALAAHCETLRVIGHYMSEIDLKREKNS